MKQITVQGMHCDACKKLIMMELEETGLDSSVLEVNISSEEKKGVFTLIDEISDDDLGRVKSVVNAMDGYTVL